MFLLLFLANNKILCDTFVYEDGVGETWLGAHLKDILDVNLIMEPDFRFSIWLGRESVFSALFTKNPPKSSHTYISSLAIIWPIQIFDFFITWDTRWSQSGLDVKAYSCLNF